MIVSRLVEAAGDSPSPGARVIEFRGRLTASARDEHLPVGQKRGSMSGPALLWRLKIILPVGVQTPVAGS